jgi:2-polyprenyl-6-methoxyphenol hydroxylase-like FAD-dependent oxidoreductase
MRIVIVGAGIGGLTCALSLAAAGFRPRLLECVAKPAPLGVGINLLPHATRELTELGLLDDLGKLGVQIEELVYLTADGREVWAEPRGLSAGYKWPQIAVHRGRLQMFLLDQVRMRLGDDAVDFGASVERVDDGVAETVICGRRRDGSRFEVPANLVIAADGIHSAVRKQFFPDEGRPSWNGVTLFRGVTRMSCDDRPARMIWAGHSQQKFAGYPIAKYEGRGELLFNWICDLKTGEPGSVPSEDWNRPADAQPLIERYRDWRWNGVDVPALIEAAEGIWQFPMVDRDPLPRWTHGRVTLLGDAAHPMYPIGSNGATQAIIDGRALAYHLARSSNVESALAAYEAERREATSRIVLLNRAHGPDQVLELARQRAPTAEHDLNLLLPATERQQIADAYKKVAGFDPATLNQRRSYSVEPGF